MLKEKPFLQNLDKVKDPSLFELKAFFHTNGCTLTKAIPQNIGLKKSTIVLL
jgi:hypothetical protein